MRSEKIMNKGARTLEHEKNFYIGTERKEKIEEREGISGTRAHLWERI